MTSIDSNRGTADPNVVVGLASIISYNEAGGMASMLLANGITETVESDVQFRPSRFTVKDGPTMLWDSSTYQYDGASNIIAIGTQTFTYDSIGRLRTADVLAPSDPNMYHQEYVYDEVKPILS